MEFFKKAVALDPTNLNGRLYLATAYMSQYIPGAESPENMQLAKEAKEEFMQGAGERSQRHNRAGLARFPELPAGQGMPDLDQKLKKLDEAKEWYLKLIAADPQNKEGYYSLAVIDWVKWYAAWMKARADLGMKPEEPGPLKDKKVKAELKEKYAAMVDDGMKNLHKALEIDKDYDDAMAYMNLLIRERADLDDTPEEYKADVENADVWVQKALDTKKMKAAKEAAKAAGGITAEPAK